MPYIKPRGEQLKRLAESADDGPVVMLNLLKFGRGEAGAGGDGGERAYDRYGEEMRSIMAERGIRVLWRGRVSSVVIGDDAADGWDEVILVQYPSRKAFLEMAGSKQYEKVGEHRTAALVDSRLFALTEQFRLKD